MTAKRAVFLCFLFCFFYCLIIIISHYAPGGYIVIMYFCMGKICGNEKKVVYLHLIIYTCAFVCMR